MNSKAKEELYLLHACLRAENKSCEFPSLFPYNKKIVSLKVNFGGQRKGKNNSA